MEISTEGPAHTGRPPRRVAARNEDTRPHGSCDRRVMIISAVTRLLRVESDACDWLKNGNQGRSSRAQLFATLESQVKGSVLEDVGRASWWNLGYTSIALEILGSFWVGESETVLAPALCVPW